MSALLGLIIIICLFLPTWTPRLEGDNSISKLEQININGTNHEIMVRGKDKENQIIIFVHGGPGCSEIPYVKKYQDLLENNFIVVHYDQRASGKSYHFFEDYSDLSVDLLVEDLLGITDYISNEFNQKKVILIGHSFGTYIATQAAYKAPEKYLAYIGIGQMSDSIQSEIDSLNYCIKEAKENSDSVDYKNLKALTTKIENGEMITPRNYIRKYGGASRMIDDNADYLKGFLFGTEYNLLDVIKYFCGVYYSQDDLINESLRKPLPNLVMSLDLPFYFIMGEYDYMTSASAAKSYFDKITTDKEKKFFLYKNSAHYPQFEEKKKFYKWMCNTFSK